MINEKAQFKQALRRGSSTYSFSSVEEFLMFKNDSNQISGCIQWHSWWGEWGDEWCGRPGQQSPGGGKVSGKINILSEKC
jgi:hypothetical protein